jgi:hypothetical protein
VGADFENNFIYLSFLPKYLKKVINVRWLGFSIEKKFS